MRTNGVGRDSPIARWVADRLWGMNIVHQFGMGTNPIQNGPEGVAVAKEHGELGILQTFDPSGPAGINVVAGGGRPSGGARSVEPNSVGFADSGPPLLGEVSGINGI